MRWLNISTLKSEEFVCGHCGADISSDKGYSAMADEGSLVEAVIMICHKCGKPNYIQKDGEQVPGPMVGEEVTNLPEDISSLYNEVRRAYSVNAFTCSVLCARKILMHVAISKGAKEKQNFEYYVNYISDNDIIPKHTKPWVDSIRDAGNETNHEVKSNTEEEASEIIEFLGMLLKLVYQYPAKMKNKESK
jgi:hypothetical protein